MTGNKVALRAVEMSDAPLIHRWENDPDVWKVSNTITPFSRYIIEQYILSSDQDIFTSKQLRLMIDRIDGKDPVPAGAIDLFDFDPLHQRAGVGILIAPEHRRGGLAREALGLLKSYAFGTLLLHQLYCHVNPENKASLELFRNEGFQLCGKRLEWIRTPGGWADEWFLQCFNLKK